MGDVRQRILLEPSAEEHAEIRELWKRHSIAEDERDLPGLISTLTDDCVYELVGTGPRWEGHEGATRFYTGLLGAFPDIDFRLTDIVVGPQGVFEEADVTGTHEAEWLGIPPSGERLAWKVAILFPWDSERRLFSGKRVYTAGLPLPGGRKHEPLAGDDHRAAEVVAPVDPVDRVPRVAGVVRDGNRPERVTGLDRVPHRRPGALRRSRNERPGNQGQRCNQNDLPEHVFAMIERTYVRVKSRRDESSRVPDELVVGEDLAVLAEVADHVPVQRGIVRATELLERGSEGDMHRPADLLVEKRVVGKPVDLVVQPERDLAEPSRALVQVEHRVEEVAAAAGLRVDDPALLEAQADAVDLAPLKQRGECERDLAFGLPLEGARVDLAVGQAR